ncbi:hypothetical protein G3435_00120 [Pseudomonas sp. MAFF212428]|uniref:Uncharacterized protein n=1 Tax=Pseudomonas brassicae TaxID=2708063 RepID=A0A6M0CSV1_9PSED|nr:hypothetical protein [Pseudomonas brassicae]
MKKLSVALLVVAVALGGVVVVGALPRTAQVEARRLPPNRSVLSPALPA